ncbi:unnamed protein product [Schistosoma haematobium]|nr:unnamed protein product [Schistosoma haematobium]
MVGKTHKCGQPNCLFPVEEGMQCDECHKWFHKMCTRLSPTAYKRCSKPNSHWLCMFCCANKALLIQEAMSLLALACKKKDGICADNTGTDSDECVSVVPAVTRRLKKLTLTDVKVESSLTLTGGVVPSGTDIVNNAPLMETEDLDKTVTVPNSPSVMRDEKWNTVRRKRTEKKKAVSSTQVVSNSLVDPNCEPQIALPKSEGKSETHPGVTEKKNLITSNIIVSKLRESNDPDPKIRHAHDLEKLGEYIRSILPDNSKGVQVKKLIRIGKRTEDNVEPRPCRLLKVILGSEKQRDLLLSSARCHDNSDIRVRPDMPLEDRIKRKKALAELETRRQNGEENLRLVGFRIVRSWKRMLPRPVWIGCST